MPRGFQFPFETPATEMYVTFAEDAATADGTKPNTEQRGNHMLLAFGRLKPGVYGRRPKPICERSRLRWKNNIRTRTRNLVPPSPRFAMS